MITNVADIQRAHRALVRETSVAIDRELSKAAKLAQEHPQRHAKFKRRTGRLQRSIKAMAARRGSVGRLKFKATAKHAAFIEYGTRRHVIRPRRKSFLRFKVKGGAIVFARQVNHPGTRPYKFGWNATWAAYRSFGPRAQRRLGRLAARF